MGAETETEMTQEQSAELLRITLPIMARHKVPVTPPNYAVWFTYTSGTNTELNEEIDGLVANRTPFTADINERLFRQFASECDVAQFLKIRGEMSTILADVSGSLATAGTEADAYGGTLENVAKNVAQSSNLDDIRGLLKVLVDETKIMRKSTQLLHEHLDSKSREISLLQDELEQERKRANSDPLTGLANRLALHDELTSWTKSKEPTGPLSLLMLDIDNFKRVNDTHGHLIGDRVIRFVAKALQDNTKGQDLAARYGGEEFAVLLPNTGLHGAETLAQRIRQTVADAKLVRSDNKEPLGQITVSLGVAQYRPGEDIMELINRADQALYNSKHSGRNKVSLEDSLQGAQRA